MVGLENGVVHRVAMPISTPADMTLELLVREAVRRAEVDGDLLLTTMLRECLDLIERPHTRRGYRPRSLR